MLVELWKPHEGREIRELAADGQIGPTFAKMFGIWYLPLGSFNVAFVAGGVRMNDSAQMVPSRYRVNDAMAVVAPRMPYRG